MPLYVREWKLELASLSWASALFMTNGQPALRYSGILESWKGKIFWRECEFNTDSRSRLIKRVFQKFVCQQVISCCFSRLNWSQRNKELINLDAGVKDWVQNSCKRGVILRFRRVNVCEKLMPRFRGDGIVLRTFFTNWFNRGPELGRIRNIGQFLSQVCLMMWLFDSNQVAIRLSGFYVIWSKSSVWAVLFERFQAFPD